ncbi:MAG TPA: exo-alpha-sialidase [Pirellulales bacterium]|jgi:predicted neuraminidase|nr:exo-alpha-sialidase [Pirellulales bacterium]
MFWPTHTPLRLLLALLLLASSRVLSAADEQLVPLKYRNPGLVVDLGVGLWAWPLPIDFDGDGDLDLVVSCPDKPSNGAYLFENPGSGSAGSSGSTKMPVFKPGRRISKGLTNVSPSYVEGRVHVLSPGNEYPDFLRTALDEPQKLPLPANIHPNKVRANQWKYVDFDGDGRLDLIVGVGDWTDYGWDDAFDAQGRWTRGPLHGFVYLLRNKGTGDAPTYAEPRKIEADGRAVDVFGMPSPSVCDFDGDGDLDLLCGEFLDGFTYFQNIGARTEPKYAAGKRLAHNGKPLVMDLEMIVPVTIDWDGDGDQDLIVGDEDGRVAFVEHTGRVVDGMPQFLPPRYFQQEAADLKCGALATPVGVDFDNDGDWDIVSGNSAGCIEWFENVSGSKVEQPRWAAPVKLEADGRGIRIQAGPNGSIQGPAEAKWGYTTLSVADWDADGLHDLIVNSIWGKVVWYRNIGERGKPRFAAEQAIEVVWDSPTPKPAWTWWQPSAHELATEWRTTPVVRDITGDGLADLVMLDHEGYLALFQRTKRDGKLVLLPGRRVFKNEKGEALQLNAARAGKSGRRKLCLVDWDDDGKLDVLKDSRNVQWLRNVADRPGEFVLRDMGDLDSLQLAGHDTSPTSVDFNGDGAADLLVGAEDGRMYYKRNPRAADDGKAIVAREFIFEEAPFAQCHASTIVETSRGLVAAWFGGTREGHKDVGIWLSREEQGKWTAPMEVANGIVSPEKRYPCWNPVLFQPRSGPLMLFYKMGSGPQPWWGTLITSDDAGRTWSPPRRLPEGFWGPIKNKPVQLADGSVLCPSSTESREKPSKWRVHFERTDERAASWQRIVPSDDTSTTGGKPLDAIQPSILRYGEKRLQAVGRTRQGKVFQTWSEDDGKSWGPLSTLDLPNPNAGTDAVTLADGRQLLVYNHTTLGRTPLNVAVSADGKNWHMALVQESGLGEFSYPAVIQSSDGLVHITYTWRRERVRHVVVDPRHLPAAP